MPLTPSQLGQLQSPPEDLLDAPEERVDILVVDDMPEKLLVFETVLEDLEQNLVFVRSGSDALREVLKREFAVILLDVNMPDIDGFETASLIRRYKKSAHTPIIFITAYTDEIQTARGYSLGAVDYILSPVVPQVLRSKVKVFVDLHVMQRRLRRQADERVALAAAEAARRSAEENERRSQFLAHASRVLAGSLDLAVGQRVLLGLVVPQVGSLAVLLLEEDGALDHALVAASGINGPPAPARYRDLPLAVQRAVLQALQGKRQVELELAEPALPQLEAPAPAGEAVVPAGRAVAVPLLSGERALGVLLVGAEEGDPVRLAGAWSVLNELASRAAIAFENASLYRSLQAEIVERRAAEAQLQAASQRKDEFLAMLSHELRNPLAPIRNAIEVIRRIAPPDPKFAWAGDVMDRQVHHLTRLVEELLDVARISQGKIALNREPVDLKTVIAHSIETAQPFIESRRHSLVVKLPERPVWLQGDFARLSQIVANLLHNAAKFSDEGSQIHLELEAKEGMAVISVADNGIGIDEALLPRIFGLFEQGTRALDRSQGGLGVGLTLVRRLVELHGGAVQAYSEGPDHGAEFRVSLPCISIVAASDAAAGQAEGDDGKRGNRVLIVDDNFDAAESVALFLQLEGHEVKTVADGMQALASVAVFAPQVVLLDIGLPVLSGYEVARRMRELPQTRNALLVALTGYGQKEDQLRAMQAGFDHHFTKPTDPHAIVRLIAQWQAQGHETPASSPSLRGHGHG